VIGNLLAPLFGALDSEAVIIPVNETLRGTESVELPYQVLKPLVEQSSVRFILNQCVCRRGENCQDYPQDLGCLFLGNGAADLHPTLGNEVTVEEALGHVERAMGLGLVPLVVQSAFDAWMFGVPYRRTLGVCFCCDCCCAVRRGLRDGPRSFGSQVGRLPGLTVDVGPECVGCGLCVEVCYVKAISIRDGSVVIDGDCKGCGRCAAVCPTRAITLHVNKEEGVLEDFVAQMGRRVAVDGADELAALRVEV
jgi:ferredoxin